MRVIVLIPILILLAAGSVAQQPQPDLRLFTSSAEVQKLIAEIKAVRKDEPLMGRPVIRLAQYRGNVEYMAGIAPAAIHEKEAEMFIVLEGSGTMVTGGKLVNDRRGKGDTILGSGIEGGTARDITKGDILMVPENTPHFISKINGELILMTLHMPGSVTPAR